MIFSRFSVESSSTGLYSSPLVATNAGLTRQAFHVFPRGYLFLPWGLFSETKFPQRPATTPHTCGIFLPFPLFRQLRLCFVFCSCTRLVALCFVRKSAPIVSLPLIGIHSSEKHCCREYTLYYNKHSGHKLDTRTARETPPDCRPNLPHAGGRPCGNSEEKAGRYKIPTSLRASMVRVSTVRAGKCLLGRQHAMKRFVANNRYSFAQGKMCASDATETLLS